MKTTSKRLLALLLALVLCLSLLPAALAEEDAGTIAPAEDPEPQFPAEEETPSEGGTIAPAPDPEEPEATAPEESEVPEEPDAPAPEDELEAVYSGSCGASMNWKLDTSTGVLTISGSGKMNNYTGSSPAPWYDYSSYITTLKVSKGVDNIGEYAFSVLRKLKSATISEGLTAIGDFAFTNCTALREVSLPSTVKTISACAFYNCGLSSITIPAKVSSIGCNAFAYNSNMLLVKFLGGPPTIGDDCFYSVTAYAFYPADNSAWTPAHCQNYGGTLFWAPCSEANRCGENLYWVFDKATGTLSFYGWGDMYDYEARAPWSSHAAAITSIDLPRGPGKITRIGDRAFSGCSALTAVTLPLYATAVGDYAFSGCSALTAVTLPWYATAVGDYAFSGCGSLLWLKLPAGVARLGEGAFADCTGMSNVSFQGGAPEIGADCFLNVTANAFYPADDSSWTEEVRQNYGGSLTWFSSSQCGLSLYWSFDEETGVLTIAGSGDMVDFGNYGSGNMPPWYEYRSNITTVVLPEGLPSIGNSAFVGCSRLKSVTIPESVTRIGRSAFDSCSGLTSMTIPEGVRTLEDSTFDNCKYLESITLPEGLETIGNYAFRNCKALKSITLPDDLETIGSSAFEGCTALASITLPDSLTDIGEQAFYGCSALKSVKLPPRITTIRYRTFSSSNLKSIIIPESVTCIESGAFYSTRNLKKIVFLGSAPDIASDSFGCKAIAYYPADDPTWTKTVRQGYGGKLTWVALIGMGRCGDELTWGLSEGGDMIISGDGSMWDYGVDSPAPWAGLGSRIRALTLEEGVTDIGDGAFDGCGAGFIDITFPDSLQTIGQGAFRGCGSLETVWIPAGLTAVGAGAFGDCGSLSWVLFLGSAPAIGPDAFASDSATVYYPGEDASWTEGVRLDYGGTLTWAPFLDGGNFGNTIYPDQYWLYTGDHILFIYGHAEMGNFDYDEENQRGKTPWAEYTGEIEALVVKEGILNLGDESFDQCVNLTKVSLPSTLEYIGSYALCGTAITELELPDSLRFIGEGGLCLTPLESITFPKSLTSLGNIALAGDTALTFIYFEGGAPRFGEKVFAYVTALGCYPAEETSWTADVCQDYGGRIIWLPCLDGVPMINPFNDVPSGKYYFAPVLWAISQDPPITSGTSEGTFSPNKTCTRAQIVTFLWNAFGQPEPTLTENPFEDVPEGKWYTQAVLWAVEKGITSGVDPSHFGPNKDCTRAQVVTFLWNAYGKPEPTSTNNPFTDVKEGKFYYKAVLWAVEMGITSGVDATHFGTNNICTRAQVVTFLYKTRDLPKP